ncbi:DEAD/DEAH box helicase family protein [Nocardioides aurantiacus]|uniref:Type I restriction enzyme R subunit n=1 Tax=Nocardioides aurantiacus TaxID=86796 RepID=A0A3N2CYG8_9ACTN|nr:DEAD/DEAH box helicase family protein [Nocardioides aurantiacus]ROR92595.1 type I restriction enzyme R subunit [Nocardioides aurantiacus]
MANFDFIKAEWPQTYADCARAEGYLASDPRTACIYARRAAEQLVGLIYDVDALPVPYKDDLSARINEAAFRNKVGSGIGAKLNLIRKLGNRAVHYVQPIPPRAAVDVLRELHHVVVWTAFRYSTDPAAVPTGTVFDPTVAGSNAPLTRAEVAALAKKFHDQDEAHAKALKERDELSAAKDAEITELRAEIKAVQAANTLTDTHDYSEAQTRELIIDELLREAGWRLTEARDREFEVTGMPNAQGLGYVDYVLWGADGLPLAVIEAKRTTKDPGIGQQQAKLYADCLETMTGRRPVILYTNGYETWLWDDAAGYPPRKVEGFFAGDELELMVARRNTRLTLADTVIDKTIVERHYQHRAIRTIGEALSARQRDALLVMATGSGKTRVVIALVDQLMRAGWVKRVLFLADRTALVNQAAGAFKAHLPNVTTVNLVTEKSADGRVYVSTYPTMMNLINVTDGGARMFGPGYFDLVVIDEAHRSVYQKYKAIFGWFDSLLVGLTATPKNEVDRNTYTLFNLEDGVPTDAYSLDEAVAEGYLVPPVGVSVPLKFMRQGIRYDELSEQEKDDWDRAEWNEEGEVPDEVAAAELNQFLFNADTVDKVLATLMTDGLKVAGGDRLGKTIVFAKNQKHAEFIRERFDLNYPEHAGHFARVITHGVTYAQSLIDDFSVKDKAPHIAISVDMLDTGIDVPEVLNLVFFKPVRAKSKFWQMIGRGTRLCPDLFGPGDDKKNFYVFDFCQNLEYFGQDLPGTEGSLQKSLGERLFETRLGLVAALDQDAPTEPGEDPAVGEGERSERGLRVDVAWSLHQVVAGMNTDNFLVRPARQWVETYSEWEAWQQMPPEKAGDVARHLAGLPSTERDDDEDAKRFDLILLRLQLARLESDAVLFERLRKQVQDIATALLGQTAIPSVKAQEVLLESLSEDDWWVDVTLPMLELARRRVRALVRFVDKTKRAVVYSNFADELGEGTIVELPGVTPGTNWERFRAKARAYLRDHEDHLALQRLRRNLQLTPDDLTALEAMLLESGAGTEADLAKAREDAHGLGLFVRSLVGLDRAAATQAFDRYLTDTTFTANQLRFVNLIVEHLTANGVMEVARLYESPFTDSAPHGPDSIFNEEQVDDIVTILSEVRDRALPDVTVA